MIKLLGEHLHKTTSILQGFVKLKRRTITQIKIREEHDDFLDKMDNFKADKEKEKEKEKPKEPKSSSLNSTATIQNQNGNENENGGGYEAAQTPTENEKGAK